LKLFTLGAEPPCLLRPGDRVRFVPISMSRYHILVEQQA
jgi:allophanate hydrolase subunit 1